MSSKQVEEYINKQTSVNLQYVFDQYLRDIRIPNLEYYVRDDKLYYRWSNTIPTFDMPVKVYLDEKEEWLSPVTTWQQIDLTSKLSRLRIDRNFYISSHNLLGEN